MGGDCWKKLGKLKGVCVSSLISSVELYNTMTRQLKRAVSPTRTATSLGSSSKRGSEAICNLAARLMMVPTEGLVAEH